MPIAQVDGAVVCGAGPHQSRGATRRTCGPPGARAPEQTWS